jgi:hypothetical protein
MLREHCQPLIGPGVASAFDEENRVALTLLEFRFLQDLFLGIDPEQVVIDADFVACPQRSLQGAYYL